MTYCEFVSNVIVMVLSSYHQSNIHIYESR